jgi:hypothetical protein
MRCGQKVPRMILLHSLSCYIKLDHIRIMSVHVSISAGCSFNTAVSVVSKLWQKYETCIRIPCKTMSSQNLEPSINAKLCAKLGRSASEMCSTV